MSEKREVSIGRPQELMLEQVLINILINSLEENKFNDHQICGNCREREERCKGRKWTVQKELDPGNEHFVSAAGKMCYFMWTRKKGPPHRKKLGGISKETWMTRVNTPRLTSGCYEEPCPCKSPRPRKLLLEKAVIYHIAMRWLHHA